METRNELMGSAYAVSPSPSPTSPIAPSGTKHKRRRNVGPAGDCCRTCRARKVRCPGNTGNGPCASCTRLELECSFMEDEGDPSRYQGKVSRTTPSRSHTEAGTLRRRAQRACQNCHIHKTKCSGELPQCKRCDANNLVCQYMPTKRNFSNVSYTKKNPGVEDMASADSQDESARVISSTPLSERPSIHDDSEVEALTAQRVLLSRDILLRHFQTWFTAIHPTQCYGFFHPMATYRQIEENQLDSAIGAAVCAASGLLLTPGPEARSFASRCNFWVKYHLTRTTGSFSRQRLMLLVLSSLYDLMAGDWPKAWEYSATASRLVTALHFNRDGTGSSFIERESNKRLTWQVFMTDRVLSGGFDEHLTLGNEKMLLSLPCPDKLFHDNKEMQMEKLVPQVPVAPSSAGTWSMRATCIRLLDIRHEILSVTKFHAISPPPNPEDFHLEPSRFMDDINRLQRQLDMVRESLPKSAKLSDANVRRYYSMPPGEDFVMLHTWILQLHLDLYRFALPGIREQATTEVVRYLTSSSLANARFQAVAFAAVLSRFWETSRTLRCSFGRSQQLLTADHALPVCVVQNTEVLLIAKRYRIFFDMHVHSRVPSFRNETLDAASIDELIESNIAVLEPYGNIMPVAEKMLRDLKGIIADSSNNTLQALTDEPAMIGMSFAPPLLEPSQSILESGQVTQVPSMGALRKGRVPISSEYVGKEDGDFHFNDTPQVAAGDKIVAYNYAVPQIAFGLPQTRTSNPQSVMVPDLGETSSPPSRPGQFHGVGIASSEMTNFAPAALSQQQPVAQPQGFDSSTSPGIFMSQSSHPQFTLPPQQIDVLMNFNSPYNKGEQPPDYALSYQEYRQ